VRASVDVLAVSGKALVEYAGQHLKAIGVASPTVGTSTALNSAGRAAPKLSPAPVWEPSVSGVGDKR
jgi:hypothetical protein